MRRESPLATVGPAYSGSGFSLGLAFLTRQIKIWLMEAHRQAKSLGSLAGKEPQILPSLLACDFGNLEKEIAQLEEAGITGFHLDVMDGHFVPNFTYGMPIVAATRNATQLPLDVHLMMSNPERYIQQFADAGADSLTIHAEIEKDLGEVLLQIRDAGVGVGLAVNPATSLGSLEQVLPLCDLLLIMSVDAGFGGQAFNPVALEKLRTVKQSHPNLLLEVDGGVNLQTINDCTQAGASLLVVGSAIFAQDDYRQAIQQLTDAIGR